ncbi:hypothetical protein GDO81_025020 [Engystomops pustulosus]|uniref:Uncharacterized protein n=1 Tax=Engystomops pustulosus TaxID=76066 RepID=A0AAV6Z7H8_ENGPU|nr:hypothetical protein GDO81_025020 [Engystomops pustulosus]
MPPFSRRSRWAVGGPALSMKLRLEQSPIPANLDLIRFTEVNRVSESTKIRELVSWKLVIIKLIVGTDQQDPNCGLKVNIDGRLHPIQATEPGDPSLHELSHENYYTLQYNLQKWKYPTYPDRCRLLCGLPQAPSHGHGAGFISLVPMKGERQ